MNSFDRMLAAQGFIIPSRFETTVKLICTVASVVAIGLSGCWQVLWAFPIYFVLAYVAEPLKRVYWKGFDPFIHRGAQHGHFSVCLFWNVLTMALDWTLICVGPIFIAFFIDTMAAGKPLSPAFKWLFFWVCINPPFLFPLKSGGAKVWLMHAVLKMTPVIPLLLSIFMSVDWVLIAVVYAVVGIAVVAISSYQRLNGWRRDFDKWRNSADGGITKAEAPARKYWRPREGVLLEPGLLSGASATDRLEFQRMLTILRVNWCGCVASLSMLIAGVVMTCIHISSLWLLLVPPCALVGLGVGHMLSSIDRGHSGDEPDVRFMPLMAICASAGVMTLWLGGHDWCDLIAAGMLACASFMFFTGFIVRQTSEGVFDTLDFVFFVCGIATMIVCRQLGCVWWESLLPLLLSAGAPGYVRALWPRRDLPYVCEHTPPLIENSKKERRERKRERQMAAFRRSSGR